MKLQRQIEQLVSQQASEWIEILKTGGLREHTAFVAWLKESRRHVNEFLAMIAVDRELSHIDPDRQHDLAALVEKISPHDGPVKRIRGEIIETKKRSIARWLRPMSLAAVVVLVALAVMLQIRQFSAQEFTTDTGEQRIVQLPDGSVVHLNTQSKIRVHVDDQTRDIRLTKGEALFKVAHDAIRPFRVRTQNAVVQAIGTEFNVYAHPHVTTVSVLEGRVQISGEGIPKMMVPSVVSAGQEVKLNDRGQMQLVPLKDAETLMAWRQRRLIFRDDTLEDMVAEFNRYNRAQFRLEGEAVRQRHYSGTFDADDPESLAALLSREADLKIVQRHGDYIIQRNDVR